MVRPFASRRRFGKLVANPAKPKDTDKHDTDPPKPLTLVQGDVAHCNSNSKERERKSGAESVSRQLGIPCNDLADGAGDVLIPFCVPRALLRDEWEQFKIGLEPCTSLGAATETRKEGAQNG